MSPPPAQPRSPPRDIFSVIGGGLLDFATGTVANIEKQLQKQKEQDEAQRAERRARQAELEDALKAEAALTPRERATRDLTRAYEAADLSRSAKDLAPLMAAIEAAEAVGMSISALRPAKTLSAQLEAQARIDKAENALVMAERRAKINGKSGELALVQFVEDAAAAGTRENTGASSLFVVAFFVFSLY